MGELDHLSYEEVPRALPGASSQPLPGTGLFPLQHPWAHPQGTAVVSMWCLTQQEGDHEGMGTLQNACKTAKGGLIKNKSVL